MRPGQKAPDNLLDDLASVYPAMSFNEAGAKSPG